MWFVFDENGVMVATFEYEIEARQLARRINGKAVWDC